MDIYHQGWPDGKLDCLKALSSGQWPHWPKSIQRSLVGLWQHFLLWLNGLCFAYFWLWQLFITGPFINWILKMYFLMVI